MTRHPFLGLAFAAALAACGGGGDDDGGDDDVTDGGGGPPTEVVMVADQGFTDPMDAVATPDGKTFIFSAFTDEAAPRAAIFSVPAEGGEVKVLAADARLQKPDGLVLSDDGKTLYIADVGVVAGELDEAGAASQKTLYTMPAGGGSLTPLAADGIREAAGLAIGPDGKLYVSGFTPDGTPAVFTLPASGGAATVLEEGGQFESLAGLYVDKDSVVWAMDNRPSRGLGGSLWSITPAGEVSEVAGGLELSQPAGVSLISAGGIAVIPERNADGQGQLRLVDTESGETTTVPSSMKDPAGIRTARQAPILAVVDSEGGTINAAIRTEE